MRFGEGDGSRMAEELKGFLKKHPTWHETKESGQAEASLEDVWPAFEEIGVTGTDLVALLYTWFDTRLRSLRNRGCIQRVPCQDST